MKLRWVGQLIYKDFYVLRGSMLYMTLLCMAVPFLASRIDQGWVWLGMWAGLDGFFLTMSNCTYEDRLDGWAWMRTLPVSASTIMVAKYVGSFLFTFAAAGLMTAFGYGAVGLGLMAEPAVPIWYYTLVPMPAVLVMGGFILWLSVRWDFRRAQLVMFGLMFSIMFLPGVGQKLVLQKPEWVERWGAGTLHFQLTTSGWLFFLGLLGLYVGFGVLAARAFARRDL